MNKNETENLVPIIKKVMDEQLGKGEWTSEIHDQHGEFSILFTNEKLKSTDLRHDDLLWDKVNETLKRVRPDLYAGIQNNRYVVRSKGQLAMDI